MNAPLCVSATLLAVGFFSATLFIATSLALAPFARVLLKRAVFGIGPRLLLTRIGGTPLEIRAIPTSSHVEIHGMNPDATDEDARPPPPLVPWFEAPPLRRGLAFALAQRIALLVIAAAILGPSRACGSVMHGCAELWRGAISPLSSGRTILQGGTGLLAREGVLALAAVAMCKWLSLGVLTLPIDLAAATARRFDRRLVIARVFVMLALLCGFASWAVAWIAWIAR